MTSTGGLQLFKPLPGTAAVMGLAVTSSGVAVEGLQQPKQPTLFQFDLKGILKQTRLLPCALSEGLLLLGSDVGSVCPDGTVIRYPASGAEQRFSSWARLGTKTQSLTQTQILVVDPVGGQLLVNDLSSNTVAPLPIAADVQMRVAQVRSTTAAAQQHEPDKHFALPAVIQATAGDGRGIYLLLYPYAISAGPLVIKVDTAGKVLQRYQCLPSTQLRPVYKIGIDGEGELMLFTVDGGVVAYPLPKS
jgi:hypothetical protein